MSGPDDTILEFYAEKDLTTTPKTVHYNLANRYGFLDISYGHLKRRMRTLADHELLTKVDGMRGGYELTDKGRAYLAGELNAEELENDEE